MTEKLNNCTESTKENSENNNLNEKNVNKEIASTKSEESKKFYGKHIPKMDPFLQSQIQHQAHRKRISMLIFASIIIATVIIGSLTIFLNYQQDQENKKKKDNLLNQVQKYENEIKKQSGYTKHVAILKAISAFRNIQAQYSQNNFEKGHWDAQIDKLYKILDEETRCPQLGSPFVLPSGISNMVFIPQGKFFMGRRTKEPGNVNELPRHEVTLTKGFWMSSTEITFNQWWFIGDLQFRVPAFANFSMTAFDRPVVGISWHHAMAFCRLLTERERKRNRIPENYEYRLPTEAEWEYACRAWGEFYYPWGDQFLPEGTVSANVWDNLAADKIDKILTKQYPPADGGITTRAVAKGTPNPFGLYDMAGNVDEWCYDWFDPDFYRTGPSIDPVQRSPRVLHFGEKNATQTAPARVIRGGSWCRSEIDSRCAARDCEEPSKEDLGIGFRIVLAPLLSDKIDHPAVLEDPKGTFIKKGDRKIPSALFRGEKIPSL